jgi:SAM-dependent methyltransferase
MRATDFPEVHRYIELIAAENPLQRRAIERFVAAEDERYWRFAESVCARLSARYLRDDAARAGAARAYNDLCRVLNAEQFRFKKTGLYQIGSASAANAEVYSQPKRMREYVMGLLLSHLFWKSHYDMIVFLQEYLAGIRTVRTLEVGVGHGLLLQQVAQRHPEAALTVVDISAASLDLAREIFHAFDLDVARIQFLHSDFLTAQLPEHGYDFIVMAEVLEHVDDPAAFLRRARTFMAPGATMYMATCANCPAPDHVYLFRNVPAIRELVRSAGLEIEREIALPLERVPEEQWEKRRVNVNYGAILRAR